MTYCDIIIMVKDMSTRMDRYKEVEIPKEEPRLSRVAKNDSLYDEIKSSELSRVKSNDNIKVLESSTKTINIDKIKKYLEENKNEPSSKRAKLSIEEKPLDKKTSLEETKEYDLSRVLEKAKKNREIDYELERHKKLKNNEFDILNKLKQYEIENNKDKEEEELNTGERTLVDLISAVAHPGEEEDLLSSLTGGATGEITLPIDEEKTDGSIKRELEKTKDKKLSEITITKVDTTALLEAKKEEEREEEINKTRELRDLKQKTTDYDRSFFTNSMTFSKEDFEGFEELEKNVKKNNTFVKVGIVILVLLAIATILVILKYVLNVF